MVFVIDVFSSGEHQENGTKVLGLDLISKRIIKTDVETRENGDDTKFDEKDISWY